MYSMKSIFNVLFTPRSRSVAGHSSGPSFAAQLTAHQNGGPPTKKFRSSAAPKGSRLAAGYQDRTQLRTSAEEDDKVSRVKALEDMVKLGQMEMATFEKLRDEIVEGDVRYSHLVKGLDWNLLKRVKEGEVIDVLGEQGKDATKEQELVEQEPMPEADVEDELDVLGAKEIAPLRKAEKEKKKGEMAPPSLAGKKRTRDEILAELKASRAKAAEEKKKAMQPELGARFTKVGQKKVGPRIETDERGREVLITVDEDGNVRRKVRKAKTEEKPPVASFMVAPDKDMKPLGMEAPDITAPEVTMDDDIDIFEGVGADYDPLGGADDSEDESEDEKNDLEAKASTPKPVETGSNIPERKASKDPGLMPPPPAPSIPKPRNYFGEDKTETESDAPPLVNPLTDPTILATLKRASHIASSEDNPRDPDEVAKLARRKKLLEAHDRDAEDMDLGFGSSRFEDQAELEDQKPIKLSTWRGGNKNDGDDDDDEEVGQGKGKKKDRKRGGGKRKGDKDNANDVLKVMARQKAEKA
jgi:hypothetical protein